MIIKCEKTGIEFDASSKRTKNHPQAMSFLNDANKDSKHYVGSYAAAKGILAEVKSSGIDDIDEAMRQANAAYAAWKDGVAKPIVRKTQGDRIRERKQRSASREATNAILRQHGYTWSKEDEESFDFAGAGAFEATYGTSASYVWILSAPDGREVSVSQALKEIESK